MSKFWIVPAMIVGSWMGIAITIFKIGGDERCQGVVLANIAKQHAFEEKLSQAVNPDFLSVMKGGK